MQAIWRPGLVSGMSSELLSNCNSMHAQGLEPREPEPCKLLIANDLARCWPWRRAGIRVANLTDVNKLD